jgi:YesN/AraC family two-component response regulator
MNSPAPPHHPLSIQQVGGQVGRQSPFYFSLRFKKATGRSPSAYRDKEA